MTNEEVNPIISAAGKNSKGILVTEESNGDKTNTKIYIKKNKKNIKTKKYIKKKIK